MDHEYFRDRVSAYHDQGLTPEETRMMQEHLEECQDCRALLEQFERLDRLVEAHSGLDGEDYWERAAQKIDQAIAGETTDAEVTDVRPARTGLIWKFAAVAASIAVIAFVGLNRDKLFEGQDVLKPDQSETQSLTAPSPLSDSMKAVEEYGEHLVESDRDEAAADEIESPSLPEPIVEKPSVAPDNRPSEAETAAPGESAVGVGAQTLTDGAEDQKEKKATPVMTPPVPANESLMIRGGRAAEIDYVVDGVVPDKQQTAKNELAADRKDKTKNQLSAILSTADSGISNLSRPQRTAPALRMWTNRDTVEGQADLEESLVVVEDEVLLDSLTKWRDRRNDLAQALQLAEAKVPGAQYSASPGTRGSKDKGSTKATAQAAVSADSLLQIRLNLIEAWYQLAAITPDDQEYNSAVEYLNQAIESSDPAVHGRAVEYLRLLREKVGE